VTGDLSSMLVTPVMEHEKSLM